MKCFIETIFRTKEKENIIRNACEKIINSEIIQDNQCLLFSALLFKYFHEIKIKTKVHIVSVDGNNPHMYISYKNKRIDITSHKQSTFKLKPIVLDKKIDVGYDLPSFSFESFSQDYIDSLDESLTKKIILSAMKNKDFSFNEKYIWEFIEHPEKLEKNAFKEDFNEKYKSLKEIIQ